MTPKERANELLSKFEQPSEQSKGNIWAKQCAIICVEQIIDAFKEADGNQECTTIHIVHYWQEVLNHLSITPSMKK